MDAKEDYFVIWNSDDDKILAIFADEDNAHKHVALEQLYKDDSNNIMHIDELRNVSKKLASKADEHNFSDDEYEDIPNYLYAIKIGDEYAESSDIDDGYLSEKAEQIEKQYLKETAEEMYGTEDLEELTVSQMQGVCFQNGYEGGNVEYVEISCEDHEEFDKAYEVYDSNQTFEEEYEEE